MNLEEISKTLLSNTTGAQNVTAAVLDLITKLGRERRKRPSSSVSIGNDQLLPHYNSEVAQEADDEAVILAHNLSTILYSFFQNDTDLLEILTNNLRDEEIRWLKEANRRLSDITFSIIISVYIIVIAFGSFGNFAVVSSFIRQPALRTQRNFFILNLAISDLVLCLVTMPLTLIDIVNKHWPLGDSELSCKVAGGLQAVSVFVSTISITVIALDRYQLIVYPTRDILKRIGGAAALFFMWLLGFLLALPMFMVRTLERQQLSPSKGASQKDTGGVYSIDYCYEKWPFVHGRVAYSVMTLLIQYALPILIISVLHTKICRRLRTRHTTVESMMAVRNTANRIEAAKRLRRRHNLLMAIAIIFSITWLPLNVLNLVLDLYNPFTHPKDEEKMAIIYAVCHLFGMSSACANPFLYGWFNDNFRNEFTRIFAASFRLCHSAESHLPSVGGNRSSEIASPEVSGIAAGQPKIEIVRSSSPIDVMAEANDGSTFWIEASTSSKLGNDVTISNSNLDQKGVLASPSNSSLFVTKTRGQVVAGKHVYDNISSCDDSVIELADDATKLSLLSSTKRKPVLTSFSLKKSMETHL